MARTTSGSTTPLSPNLLADAPVEDAPPVTSREHLRRFQFIREIASGGFGSVFLTKVMHADGFSRLVAVKLLKSQWSDSDEVARRMRDEARLLGLLRHRNIVDVIDLTAIDGRAAVIMEYLEAVDFRTVVQGLAGSGRRIPLRAALEMASSVASALDAAYNRPPIPGDKPLRVIHRDIKPSNIMVDDTGMVKVLDFGVARSEIDNRESHTQELQFGSVDYMAPERLFFEPETPASDVYSLAATLFEILALEKFGKARGRPARHQAYIVDRLSFLRAQVGVGGAEATELEKLIGGGLAFNHEDRPTASEFHQRARALARAVDGDDLAHWSERVIPELLQASTSEAEDDSPLSGQTLSEDPRAFGSTEHQPKSQSAGSADILRQGALAEMEDTGAFVPSPQTGAPAQLHGRAEIEPDPEDDWDDGPTAVGGLKGPVRVPRPGNSEEARLMKNGGGRKSAPVLPDPSDPFAQLVRSPLSPPKTPTAKPKPVAAAADDDGDTEVADSLRPPSVPVNLGTAGHYDPSAPEASGPIPPLPAPPGVQPRPLEPVLPKVASPPENVAPPAIPETSSASESVVGPPPMIPAASPAASVVEPEAETVVAEGPVVPVVAPPGAVYEEGEATAFFMASSGADKSLKPVQLTATDTPAASPPPPSLDDVVPRSADSRYGPDLERLEQAERVAQSAPVIPEYVPTHDEVEPPSMPSVVSGAESAENDDDFYAPTERAVPAASPFHEPTQVAAPSPAVAASAPVAVAPTLNVRPDVEPDEPPATKPAGSRAPLFAAAGCFVFVLMAGAGLGGAYALGFMDSALSGGNAATDVALTDGADGTAAPAAANDTASEAPAAAAGDVPDGAMQVVPGIDDLRKFTVSCGDDFKEEAQSAIVVPAGTAGPCDVRVILNNRRRLRATLEAVQPGRVVCFADGADKCAPE